MMGKGRESGMLFLVCLSLLLIFSGCEEQLYEQPKYQKPGWIEGKLFTQLEKEEDLGIFISCLKKTGYDTLINQSGLYTVFAPTDEAFQAYFSEHTKYSSVDDIPGQELQKLVKYQIVQNSWSKDQIQMLDTEGWIDRDDEFYNKPRGYKRETLLRPENREYPVLKQGNNIQIVRENEANTTRVGFARSRKYCPIFFQEYFDIYELSGSDYEFYFNRPFERGEIYFAGAMITSDEIFAENGFLYKTDKVIEPLKNGEEILETVEEGNDYSDFLALIHEFPEFNSNMEATYNQQGAEEGREIDTLYDINYPGLVFNISSELSGPNTNQTKYTIRYHNGLLAPTNEAFQNFITEYIVPGWGGLDALPGSTKKILINSHMSTTPVYKTDLSVGFLNGERDSLVINESDIVQTTYGSNCTFLGLNKTVVPRAFISICRPIYLTRNYEIMMGALETTKALSALKRKNTNYSFYVPSDKDIGFAGDSSLVKWVTDAETNQYALIAYNRAGKQWEWMNTGDLRKMVLNQVAVENPLGLAKKEFLPNLAGNYIVVNNENNTVQGSERSTYGFNGDSTVYLTPELYNQPTDNGKTYNVSTFFGFSTGDFFGILSAEHPVFFNLLKKCGLFDNVYYEFPFLTEGENYTAFIPTAEALNNFGADTIPNQELRQILKYHFIKGEIIFTDGRKPIQKYETTQTINPPGSITTEYSTMYISPQVDAIEILDDAGDVYMTIAEEEGKTNRMVMTDTDEESQSRWDFITTSVIHTIDRVIVRDSLIVE